MPVGENNQQKVKFIIHAVLGLTTGRRWQENVGLKILNLNLVKSINKIDEFDSSTRSFYLDFRCLLVLSTNWCRTDPKSLTNKGILY